MTPSTQALLITRAPNIRDAKVLQASLECVEVILAFVAPDRNRVARWNRGSLFGGLADYLLGDSEPLRCAERTQVLWHLFGGEGHGCLLHGAYLDTIVGPVSDFGQDHQRIGPLAVDAASTTLTGTRTLWPSQQIAPAQPLAARSLTGPLAFGASRSSSARFPL